MLNLKLSFYILNFNQNVYQYYLTILIIKLIFFLKTDYISRFQLPLNVCSLKNLPWWAYLIFQNIYKSYQSYHRSSLIYWGDWSTQKMVLN